MLKPLLVCARCTKSNARVLGIKVYKKNRHSPSFTFLIASGTITSPSHESQSDAQGTCLHVTNCLITDCVHVQTVDLDVLGRASKEINGKEQLCLLC